jgi:hypothetical protein
MFIEYLGKTVVISHIQSLQVTGTYTCKTNSQHANLELLINGEWIVMWSFYTNSTDNSSSARHANYERAKARAEQAKAEVMQLMIEALSTPKRFNFPKVGK